MNAVVVYKSPRYNVRNWLENRTFVQAKIESMKIRYLGQSCFHIETVGKKLLFDPFISGNALAAHIDIDSLDVDYILLTHGHQDHVLDAEAIARRTGAKIISNFEIVSWYESKGIDGHPMNHGGSWEFDFGTVRFVNAIHSSVLPDGSYGGNPGGFVISNGEGSFYHAGDTALTMDMKLIPLLYPALNFAILPVGDNFTMDYNSALHASHFIECDHIVACHYDTFGFIEIADKDVVKKAFAEAGKEIHFIDIGDSIQLP